jgi:HPt (histidine-containing phosphotransfer) domain-containing protein
VKKVVEAFIHQSPDLLSEIQGAIASSDSRVLERAAHKLKSSLSYFSAPSAADAAVRLEQMGRSGNLSGAEPVYLRLKTDVSDLEKALNRLLVKM